MNLAWIAALAVLVLAEKMPGSGRRFSQMVGAASVAGGLYLAYCGMFPGR